MSNWQISTGFTVTLQRWKINFHAERPSDFAVATPSTSSNDVPTSTACTFGLVFPVTFRRSTRKDGYVKEHGVEKRIEGVLKMLISRPGKHNLAIYELVAAPTFGKGFGTAYLSRPDAKSTSKGKKEDLNNMKIEDMFTWYNRSVLGAKFGANRVDEDIRDFSLDAAQEEPVAPMTLDPS
ncbi:hypothetical protein LTR41_011752 [Exophiala xenobiotica]|nr:hypothetical protein LTR41_011752 [Exophiala xenobiotica]KAK5550539.1 hypothetical protein LTR46_011457 [Exophiala xenobiotica]